MAERPFIFEERIKDENILKKSKDLCPVNVFDEVDGKVIVSRPKDCIGCHACESQCVNDEIVVREATPTEFEVIDTPKKRFSGDKK